MMWHLYVWVCGESVGGGSLPLELPDILYFHLRPPYCVIINLKVKHLHSGF